MKQLFNKLFSAIILTGVLISCCTQNQSDTVFVAPESNNRDRLFDSGWLFHRGIVNGAEKADFNDSGWRKISLPHDWSIEDVPPGEDSLAIGPFSKKSPGAYNTGYFISGIAWYRKHFRLTKQGMDMQIAILFDGIYKNSEVWINGYYLGLHPNGYTPFYYNLTKYLRPAGENNVIAVKVTNESNDSRWYTGSGIYRHVYLNVTNAVSVAQWGVYITTPKVSESEASVLLDISVQNKTDKSATVNVKNKFFSPKGQKLFETESQAVLKARSETTVEQSVAVNMPMLWSDLSPSLYSVQTEIWKDSQLLDQTKTKFGIRSLEFDSEKGLLLNGKPTKLRGGCIHNDNGILGSVTYDRAEQRKLEILKANGFNAIRTSHNPPSKTLLDACDRLGIMVIDEAFDEWRHRKILHDNHPFFQEWWKKDLKAMMMRDRNHPSIIIWSVGNEIPDKDPKWFYAMADSLVKTAKEFDNTRPVTQAICCHGYNRPFVQKVYSLYEVQSYNYEMSRYEKDKKEFPNHIFVGTETFPKDAYENELLARKHPWVIGDFVWTAMDYFGEVGIGRSDIYNKGDKSTVEIGRWPWYISWSGDFDVCGFKKPQSNYRDVVWGRSMLEMMVHQPIPPDSYEFFFRWSWPNELPHWTWPGNEGRAMNINVYTSCEQVRLELNGKPIATKKMVDSAEITPFEAPFTGEKLRAIAFEVPYTPEKLRAIGMEDGKEVALKEFVTAGKPDRLHLTSDRRLISSNINDLSYVKVEMIDKDGTVVPVSGTPIRFSIEGAGELAAVGNGNPTEMQSFSNYKTTLFRGKCLAIVRSNGVTGKMKLKAETDGLKTATLEINCK